jgi:hypothetical protein
MLSFGLEENEYYEEAELTAIKSLEINQYVNNKINL